GITVPADPEGTLDRVSGGELGVGVTERPPWVDLPESGDPTGVETDLVREFADELDADIRWIQGSEQKLIGDLEHGKVDLVISGIPENTPWSERAGMTRPHRTVLD